MSKEIVIPPGQEFPSQAAWEAMVSASDRIQILAGGMLTYYDSQKRIVGYPLSTRVIFESCQSEDLTSLQECVRLGENGKGVALMDGGGELAFRFFQGEKQLALLGFHRSPGSSFACFSWDRWFGIGPLLDSQGLLDWLKAHHVAFPTLEERAEMQEQRKQAHIEQTLPIWLSAMPAPLVSLLSLEQHRDLLDVGKPTDLAPLQQALEERYPDPLERARLLFHWYGSNHGTWTRFPAHELTPAKMLERMPIDVLVQAIDGIELSAEELEGAGRYFSGGYAKRSLGYAVPIWKYLPERLCQRLLTHALSTPNRELALKTFAPPPDVL